MCLTVMGSAELAKEVQALVLELGLVALLTKRLAVRFKAREARLGVRSPAFSTCSCLDFKALLAWPTGSSETDSAWASRIWATRGPLQERLINSASE